MTSNSGIYINTPSVASETIEQETVIINFDTGMYYSTNRVGAVIWIMIEEGTEHDTIVARLAHTYDGDRAAISQAVQLFIDELHHQSLIVFTDEAPLATAPQMPSLPAVRPAFFNPVLDKYMDMAELLLLDPVHEIEDRWLST